MISAQSLGKMVRRPYFLFSLIAGARPFCNDILLCLCVCRESECNARKSGSLDYISVKDRESTELRYVTNKINANDQLRFAPASAFDLYRCSSTWVVAHSGLRCASAVHTIGLSISACVTWWLRCAIQSRVTLWIRSRVDRWWMMW